MPDLDHHTTPSGGWTFTQPQTGWTMPTPVAWTFSQAVQNIIKHRRANPAIVVRYKLATDVGTVSNELDLYTRLRLGIPAAPTPSPKTQPRFASPQAVGGGAVAAVKNLAAGSALLFEWEETGIPPVTPDVAEARAAICATCRQNQPGALTSYFTQPISEVFRSKLKRLTDMSMTTPYDEALNVCVACLCPLKLKVHAPMELILKHLRPETKSVLAECCWILEAAPK